MQLPEFLWCLALAHEISAVVDALSHVVADVQGAVPQLGLRRGLAVNKVVVHLARLVLGAQRPARVAKREGENRGHEERQEGEQQHLGYSMVPTKLRKLSSSYFLMPGKFHFRVRVRGEQFPIFLCSINGLILKICTR